MQNRAQKILMVLLLLGIGYLIWAERGQFTGGSEGEASLPPVRPEDRFTIVQKVKPGGYIGWHESERDSLTQSERKTRQASNFYFVCRDQSGATRYFQVSERTYNAERVGNVLTGRDMHGLRETHSIEEPALPPSFQFRRRE